MNKNPLTRRDFLALCAALGLAPAPVTRAEDDEMLTRKMPQSGEALPVIGLGTYSVFDIDDSPELLAVRREIVAALFDKGGSVIDSSPMYNRSERVVGDVLAAENLTSRAFLATKVWTDGQAAGEAQMARSAELMRSDVIDLMQVHNLRDLDVHMGTIRDWQQDGRIRYNGITHYRASALDELAAAMRRYRPDAVQINYSLGEREADRELLPLAADLGIAVLINRPYMAGQLFRAVRGQALPDWAQAFADSWGQFYLKYIVSHPAVTAVIPATSKPHHMLDNLGAGFGTLPDPDTRRRMERYVDNL